MVQAAVSSTLDSFTCWPKFGSRIWTKSVAERPKIGSAIWTQIWSSNWCQEAQKAHRWNCICWCQALARQSKLPSQVPDQLGRNRGLKPIFGSKNGLDFGPLFGIVSSTRSAAGQPMGKAAVPRFRAVLDTGRPLYSRHDPCRVVHRTALTTRP